MAEVMDLTKTRSSATFDAIVKISAHEEFLLDRPLWTTCHLDVFSHHSIRPHRETVHDCRRRGLERLDGIVGMDEPDVAMQLLDGQINMVWHRDLATVDVAEEPCQRDLSTSGARMTGGQTECLPSCSTTGCTRYRRASRHFRAP